ncbi:lasso peptide biosynthesis B2 protein [Novosphingobium sp. KACC 22771]|uniref:lasso peptide biosynthesis B2 protein n=1 Tax=Novosphingobium sp. KACC 22771 TaxID=3025670 RepID=UPI002365AD06|nr:lasso peptide biosynthesis B2 protein [Novosphingobium sp. KACC 22771]WDF74228.1 lasso peptide biosynthesis B2 protein [Novosphingobium sp. KACC 22771]
MGYSLGETWSFCIPEEQVVLMDIERNAYVALPPSLAPSFERLRRHEALDGDDIRCVDALIRTGILVQNAPDGAVTPCSLPMEPVRGFDAQDLLGWSLRDCLQATFALGKARNALLHHNLAGILAEIRDQQTGANCVSAVHTDLRARAVASAFYRMNAFVTRYDQCLLRSLAMIRCLLASRVQANLIFGVATRPFRAHCWVQQGDLVLNDTLEGIRNYTPILVS